MARNKFEKYFSHKPRRLLRAFPADALDSRQRERFWAFPKRLPRPVTFKEDNQTHTAFVGALARAFAGLFGIEVLFLVNK